MAVIVAVGVNTDGQREVLGLKVDASEAEPFRTEFLRSLNRQGLRRVTLAISDSHEGIEHQHISKHIAQNFRSDKHKDL